MPVAARPEPSQALAYSERVMTKRQAGEAVQTAMREHHLTFAELAERLGRAPVWVAAAVLGQHPFTSEEADEALVAMLGLRAETAAALQEIPTRGGLDAAVPVDPTIYRLYEVIQVYGPALKGVRPR